MKKNDHSMDSWAQDSYETGSTKPPKSHSGLVAVMMVLVIFLCGIASYLSVMNIRLGYQLQQAEEDKIPIEFLPQSTDVSYPEESTATGGILPGVEGRTVSAPEQSFYHWPAGIVVTKVIPGSQGAKAGLTVGDIITAVNGQKIENTEQLALLLEGLEAGTTVTVTFCYDGSNDRSFSCTLE